jgi:hypothetical protein
MRSARWLLVALATVAMISVGCSNDPVEDGNAIDTSGADPEQGVKFAECIRENGVSDFPDPNAKGEFAYGVSVSPAAWTRAVEGCKELQPPGALSAERTPEQQSAALEFAQCVRENGVKDFPDPVSGEPIIDTTAIPGPDTPEFMAILNAATEKCGNALGDDAPAEEASGSGG